jgi:hypothetical protein
VRLNDLVPRWVGERGANGHWDGHLYIYDTERSGMGITFDCPLHLKHRLAVMFANPIDGGTPMTDHNLWQRTGETFDDLTLSPSIDASQHGCWHGFITNGEVT